MSLRENLRRFFTAGESYPAQSGVTVTSGWAFPAARRMFWIALLLRLLYITLAHTYRFGLLQDHFQFGWEMGRIARALVTGFGYADPFDGHTGPTAWTPPLYPLLMAAAFKLFGVYTASAGWAILAANSIFSAAVAPAVYEIGMRCYGPRPDGRKVALWSGWLWALYPAAMQYAVRWPWEMSLTCCLFTWALVFGLRLRGIGGAAQERSAATWSFLGLLWGLAALCNSSVLLLLPIQAVWILWPLRHRIRERLVPAMVPGLLGLVVFLACLAPWVVRNATVFHAFVPMRSNFGAELYEAASPGNEGFPLMATLPIARDTPQLRHYAKVGELAYSRERGSQARAMIARDPLLFAEHVLLRFQFFWASVPHPPDRGWLNEMLREEQFALLSVTGILGLALSLWRRVPGATLFTAAFLLLPLIYYIVTVQARFRHPLEPLIDLFTVYLFQNADKRRTWPSAAGSRGRERVV